MRFLLAAVALFCFHSVKSQNLFDRDHTSRFARYLYNSGQYKLAAQEYERWVFMSPNTDSARVPLIKSYRKAGDLTKGLSRLHDLYADTFLTNKTVLKEWSYLQLLQGHGDSVQTILLASPQVDANTKNYILMNTALLQKQWKPATMYYNQGLLTNAAEFEPYRPVFNDISNLKHKSPALAAAFSAVVPGTGKVYTGQWKDGVIATIMIGACAYQAFRGYQLDGFNSVRFWAFAGFGTGFYLGNIYGSVKSAKKYNQKHEDEAVAKARSLFMVGD